VATQVEPIGARILAHLRQGRIAAARANSQIAWALAASSTLVWLSSPDAPKLALCREDFFYSLTINQ
jgi:hypothetical protein